MFISSLQNPHIKKNIMQSLSMHLAREMMGIRLQIAIDAVDEGFFFSSYSP